MPVADLVDLALCMTVNPGWGGQAFIPGSERKVARLRELLGEGTPITVDGGIDASTAGPCAEAGATLFVAGSSVFGGDDPGRRLPRGGRGGRRGLSLRYVARALGARAAGRAAAAASRQAEGALLRRRAAGPRGTDLRPGGRELPETARGAAQVRVQCFDRRSRTVTNELYPWPFVADGMGDRLPHVHQRGLPQELNRVVRCRIVGTDPALQGELPLAR